MRQSTDSNSDCDESDQEDRGLLLRQVRGRTLIGQLVNGPFVTVHTGLSSEFGCGAGEVHKNGNPVSPAASGSAKPADPLP